MGIGKDQLELVADGNSLNHVADSGANSAEDCISLLLLEPHSELESAGFGLLTGLLADFDGDVFEPAIKGAKLALNHHFSRLDVHGHTLGDLKLLFSQDVLHL